MVNTGHPAGLAYLQGLNLERIVMCQLNPLRVCLPAVTNMFAAITRYSMREISFIRLQSFMKL